MKTILYLECNSGISGDMMVGALLDLGAKREKLEKAMEASGIHGYSLYFGRTKKCGIDAYDFDVILEAQEHKAGHGHSHHEHRNLEEVKKVLQKIPMGECARKRAERVFQIVAEAEAEAHGIPVEEVHFHEVGAIDSIVDIAGFALCMEEFSVDQVILSPLTEGKGNARCQHGIIPVPVPAVANIARKYGIPIHFTQNEGEMITPTGAAIAAELFSGEKLEGNYKIRKIGIGAGKKEFSHANILRAMLLETED